MCRVKRLCRILGEIRKDEFDIVFRHHVRGVMRYERQQGKNQYREYALRIGEEFDIVVEIADGLDTAPTVRILKDMGLRPSYRLTGYRPDD